MGEVGREGEELKGGVEEEVDVDWRKSALAQNLVPEESFVRVTRRNDDVTLTQEKQLLDCFAERSEENKQTLTYR